MDAASLRCVDCGKGDERFDRIGLGDYSRDKDDLLCAACDRDRASRVEAEEAR